MCLGWWYWWDQRRSKAWGRAKAMRSLNLVIYFTSPLICFCLEKYLGPLFLLRVFSSWYLLKLGSIFYFLVFFLYFFPLFLNFLKFWSGCKCFVFICHCDNKGTNDQEFSPLLKSSNLNIHGRCAAWNSGIDIYICEILIVWRCSSFGLAVWIQLFHRSFRAVNFWKIIIPN